MSHGGSRVSSSAGPSGLVCVDKPVGPTSFTVMRGVQRLLGATRAGHAGTLDPAASGVLVVLLGEATKLSQWAMTHDKEYVADIAFGVATDTLDAEGTLVAQAEIPAAALDRVRVESALRDLARQTMQVPPAYSAIKKDGRTLMSRARAGEPALAEARAVVCHALELLSLRPPHARLRVASGAGYYVRALARDLGCALGVPAHLAALIRTRVGPWRLEDAATPGDLTDASIVPIARALPSVLAVHLAADEADAIAHGRPIPARSGGARAILLAPDGAPLAMAERTGRDQWQVVRGFVRAPAGSADARRDPMS